jgi:glycine C-acetyltransferase
LQSRPDYLDKTYDMFLGSIDGEQAETVRFSEWMDDVVAADAYAFEASRAGHQGPELEVRRANGRPLHVINMSSYNYLGLGYHRDVIEAAKAALDRYGLGAASSPVQSGTFEVHRQLEDSLARFYGAPGRAVSLFSSGYAVNTGTISALVKKHDHLVMDRAVHMSMLEGAQLSRASVSYFEHNDADDLAAVLKRLPAGAKRVLVCAEGVYSADGDFGALRDIVTTAKRHGAKVLVDEAHSFLVAGPTGRGVVEEAGVLDDVDLFVVTFSKALGGVGGALIAPQAVVRYVNWYARCRMFSCAIDPAVTAGVLKALEIASGPEGRARRARLHANAAHLRSRLSGVVDLGRSQSWIVTVRYGDEEKTIPLMDMLQREGLDAGLMQFPAVPINEARIRLFVTSEHTTEQLDRAAAVITDVAGRLGFRTDAS